MNIFKSLFTDSSPHLNAVDAKARIDDGQPLFILDVRQPSEFASGHIAGAKLIPLSELSQQMEKLPKNTDILCVCRSGSRSRIATNQLNKAGFKAINLSGGMMGWQRASYPIKKGK